QKFTECPRPGPFDPCSQLADALLYDAGFVIVAVRLAVRFEAAALIEMEQCPSELMRRKRTVESRGAKLIGVQRFECLSFALVGRHKAEGNEVVHEVGTAAEIPVPPAPHAAGDAPLHGKRCAILWVTSVAENSDTAAERRTGASRLVQFHHPPTDGVGSQVQSKPVAHASSPT